MEHLEIKIVDFRKDSQPPAEGRSEKAAVSATASPAAAETARVIVVGGAGPRVLSSLLWVSLSVATAAVTVVTVQGPGRGWAGLFSGSLPLGCPAVVARRRAEKIEDADCNLHISALVSVHRIWPPAGEEAVGQVADAAPVLSWDDVASEDKLHVAGVESWRQLAVEVFEILHELLAGLYLSLIVRGDVGTVCEIVAAGFQEKAGESTKDENMPVSTGGNQSVKLLERAPEEGEGGDGQVSQLVKEPSSSDLVMAMRLPFSLIALKQLLSSR
jgi:hypothetical protein